MRLSSQNLVCQLDRSIAPVENLIWGDVRSLEGTRTAPSRKNTVEAVARSLKMKVHGAAYRDAGTGRSFPMWAFSRETKSVTSVYSSGEWAYNFPGKRSGELYNSSADGAFKSSFQALQIPNRTNGRASALCSSAWHMRAAFSCRRSLSMRPLEAGCHAVVRVTEDPVRVARVLKRRASNCQPWSVVICWGQLKRATQTESKALATASSVMSRRGTASGQRVYLSMAVRQYRKPEDTGSGPTWSVCT